MSSITSFWWILVEASKKKKPKVNTPMQALSKTQSKVRVLQTFCRKTPTLLFGREVRPRFPAEGRQRIGLRGTVRPRDWAIQSTPASSYCLGRSTFEYSLSLRPNRWERLRRRTAFSPLLFLFAIKCISNGTTLQKAISIREEKAIAFPTSIVAIFAFSAAFCYVKLHNRKHISTVDVPQKFNSPILKIKLHLRNHLSPFLVFFLARLSSAARSLLAFDWRQRS